MSSTSVGGDPADVHAAASLVKLSSFATATNVVQLRMMLWCGFLRPECQGGVADLLLRSASNSASSSWMKLGAVGDEVGVRLHQR